MRASVDTVLISCGEPSGENYAVELARQLRAERPELRLPHPGLLTRSFFLWPLVEICPNASCPGTGHPLKAYLPRRVSPPILRTLPGFKV